MENTYIKIKHFINTSHTMTYSQYIANCKIIFLTLYLQYTLLDRKKTFCTEKKR